MQHRQWQQQQQATSAHNGIGACNAGGAKGDTDAAAQKDGSCSILVPRDAELALAKDEDAILMEIASATQCRISLSEPGCFFPGTNCRIATAHGLSWDLQRCLAMLAAKFWGLCQLTGPDPIATATVIVPKSQLRRITGRSGHLQQQLARSTRCLISVGAPAVNTPEQAVSVTGKPVDLVKAIRVICRRIWSDDLGKEMPVAAVAKPEFSCEIAAGGPSSRTILSLALEPGSSPTPRCPPTPKPKAVTTAADGVPKDLEQGRIAVAAKKPQARARPATQAAVPSLARSFPTLCSQCSERVRSDFHFCPNCGASFDEHSSAVGDVGNILSAFEFKFEN